MKSQEQRVMAEIRAQRDAQNQDVAWLQDQLQKAREERDKAKLDASRAYAATLEQIESVKGWRQRAADAERRALAIQEESDKRWSDLQKLKGWVRKLREFAEITLGPYEYPDIPTKAEESFARCLFLIWEGSDEVLLEIWEGSDEVLLEVIWEGSDEVLLELTGG